MRASFRKAAFRYVPATISALLLMVTTESLAADFLLIPSLTVSEEYNDNVFEDNIARRSDYITRLMPGLAMKYKAPLWDWDLGYAFDYRYYARGSRNDDTTHNINARGLVKIIDEKLFLEVSDTYKRVSLDVSRDTTNESLFFNQSDQNVATVSPYVVLHPSARLTLKSGYRYINTWYKDPSAISRQDHVLFIDNSYEMTPKFFLTAGYTFTREEASGNSLYRHETYLGPRYEYADKSFIFAQGGAIISDFDNRPGNVNPSWSAGITHAFDTMTATISTGVKYSDDPRGTSTLETSYSAILAKELKRGTVTLQGSYTEYSDATIDRLKNTRYSTGFSSTYEFIPDLRGTLGLTFEYYTDEIATAITRKYFVDSGLAYSFGKELSAGLTYRYIDYSSAKIATDNKQINRVILEVRKTF